MNDNKYSLLLLEPNKSNKEDESDYDEKDYKNNGKYKINKYEKFKPKNKYDLKETEKVIKGAENQIKSILSNFLKDIKSEKNNSDLAFKQISSLKNQNDLDNISVRKKSITKILHKTNTNKNNNRLKGNNSKKVNQKSNSNSNSKKVHFSLSPRRKAKKLEAQNNYNYIKINTEKNSDFIEPVVSFSLENNIYNNKRMHSGKNIKILSKKSNNIKALIKKNQTQKNFINYINFKNGEINLYNNDNKDKKQKKLSSFKNFISNIRNNIKQFAKNKNNKNTINIIKESKINRILTENNINQNYITFASNKAQIGLLSPKKSESLFKKQKIIPINSDTSNNIKLNTRPPSIKKRGTYTIKNKASIKSMKRSETSKDNEIKKNKGEDQVKFLKLISNFKSLKQAIKQSIILRPEVYDNQKVSEVKYKKNGSNKSPRKLISNQLSMGPRSIKLGDTSKTLKKLKSETMKNIGNLKVNEEPNFEVNNDNINTENEIKPSSNKDAQISPKVDSFHDFSFHSIKRKKVIHLEKYRQIYHKGIIYDSLDDEEMEDEEDINIFYIDPNSNFCFIFDLILLIITYISFIEVPFYLAMNLNFCRVKYFSFNDIANRFIELMNILDLFFGFFRAFYNWEEQLVKKNRIIASKYLFGWFLFDLIAAIPVYSINKIFESSCESYHKSNYYNFQLDNIQYLFICNRLFKLLKIFSKNQAWKYISNKINDFWNLISNICLILLALNYTACLYIFISRNSYPNWILKAKLNVAEFKDIYICAIYILLMTLTTVGYGDITCCSFLERIFQVFLLIIGIIAYSWLVSSFSNFVQKLNEKSADYEKKKSILDEIKINNPNLPDELYERILRYLKFRHFHEKNFKNIIFDCLPVGLKNNLIYEMYKPIIKNFIFFKNFQNTDFIVQVILSFKPILAYKNDILVNENDLIEDIIFVKQGVLSVELPINMTDPQENIQRYLNIPVLNKDKEKETSKMKSLSNIKNDTFSSFIGEKPNKVYSFGNSSTINSSLNYRSSFMKSNLLTKVKTVKIQKAYVKLLGIRENEHFGDVLMFLEERSPLRVRVRSKKSELFFLKKIDALKISTSYPNIWRRINKKSVYNFKQIKKSIKKIVEIYCCAKKVNENISEDDNGSNDTLKEKFGLNEDSPWAHNKNYDFNNSALKSLPKYSIRRTKSQNYFRVSNKNIFKNNENIDDDYFDKDNENINMRKCHSIKEFKYKKFLTYISQKYNSDVSPISFSDSFSSELSIKEEQPPKNKKKNKYNIRSKKKKLTKKLLDVFNRNYKYYKGINKSISKKKEYPVTIITEETDKECSLNPMLNNNNSVNKYSMNSKAKMIEDDGTNPINKKKRKSKNRNKKKKQSLFGLKDIEINNYGNNKNKKFLIKTSSDEDIESQIDEQINNEIYPGELIEINQEENLFNKKFNNNSQYNIETNLNINSNIETKNRDLERLLNYFDEESKELRNNTLLKKSSNYKNKKKEKEKSLKSSKVSKSGKNFNNVIFNQESSSSSSSNSSENGISLINLKGNWDTNILSVNNSVSLRINSSYENYNVISGNKLIKSKSLQNKLKTYLINEVFNDSSTNLETNIIKKTRSSDQKSKNINKEKSEKEKYQDNRKTASSIVYNTTNINYINSVSFLKNKPKRAIKKSSSNLIAEKTASIFSTQDNHSVNYIISKKKNLRGSNINLETEISSHINSCKINNIKFNNKLFRKKTPNIRYGSSKNLKNYDISHHNSFNINSASFAKREMNFETSKEIHRKLKAKRRSSILIPTQKSRKKKDNLLSLIDYNIQRTNQKLKDPDGFYSSYFSNILKEELKEKNKKNNKNNISTIKK